MCAVGRRWQMWQGARLGATGAEFVEETVGVLSCRKRGLAVAGTRRRFVVTLVIVAVAERRDDRF